MMNNYLVNAKGILLLVALSLGAFPAQAKRSGPKDVPPVTVEGVKYSAPHWGKASGKTQNGGYIQANSVETGKLLWELRVYEIKYDTNLEGDVQDVFITSVKLVDGNLEVGNERGDTFVVDLAKRKVIKGADRVYQKGK